MSVLSHPDIQLAIITPVHIFPWLKGKIKNEDSLLALKVLIRFKILTFNLIKISFISTSIITGFNSCDMVKHELRVASYE